MPYDCEEGGDIDLDAVLRLEEIFKDASKGKKRQTRTSSMRLSTTDPTAIRKTDHHRR